MNAAVGDGLVAAVAEGDRATARRLVEVLSRETDKAVVNGVLDGVARLAAAGSEVAVELLVEVVDEFGIARRAVRRYIIDEDAVDDVTQNTLITMIGAIHSFRSDAKFTTWLHTLARNRAVDYIRRHRTAAPLGENDPRQDAAVRMSSMIASRESVRQMLERLPPLYRDAVTLRDVEQLPYHEIGRRLERPVNTVKSQVARGRALLAAQMREEFGQMREELGG